MGIKKIVKYSFITIGILIVLIFSIDRVILYQIQENDKYKKNISDLVVAQESMNNLIESVIDAKNIDELFKIKENFVAYEHRFELLQSAIHNKDKADFIDYFIEDIDERGDIAIKLNQLMKNEKNIEIAFDTIYKIQLEQLEFMDKFNLIYPNENLLRKEIEELIVAKKDFQMLKELSDMKYYSKEFIFQKKTEEYYQKWISKIEFLSKKINSPQSNNYLEVAMQVGKNVLHQEYLLAKERQIVNSLVKILESSNMINQQIEKDIEQISLDFKDLAYLFNTIFFIVIILLVVVLSYKVNKNVELSVDEIEKKVNDGLSEINKLNHEIEDTQKEVVFTMGAIGETRSKETGNHVKRVAEYSKLFATLYGLSDTEAEMLKQASPMHDIGKVGIPDSILNKPGRFDDNEREIMNTHAQLGYDMLKHSTRPLLQAAAIVAYEHHEKWDGSGYPRGLSGEDIHIFGRITALADVFDALGSDRCYKKAWEDERIFNLFKEESGKHFEPKLVDLFFANLDKFLKIRDKFKDIE